MAIEAPISKYKKTNYKISIAVCIGLTIWCIYDGYFSEKFKEKYSDAEGNPVGWLVVNRKAPPYLLGIAVLLAGYLFVLRKKKIIADENELVFSDSDKIPYDTIERIDKTHFEKKGFFVFTFKNKNGKEVNRKLSDRTYDNLKAVLDHLVAKIS
ncbi:MAG: hypothetical protein JSW59_19285 [Phycisphaerales bacterium]|nr:MAG: hypothetical protein JSW59_19285 [Phycisphaerales bacterium]